VKQPSSVCSVMMSCFKSVPHLDSRRVRRCGYCLVVFRRSCYFSCYASSCQSHGLSVSVCLPLVRAGNKPAQFH